MKNKQAPYFISFEGIDGSGKTQAIESVYEKLKNANVKVIKTREPGGTELAEQLRKIIKEKRDEKIIPETELLLISAARAQHVHNHIIPMLNQGYSVLCDRFSDATLAYQGGGRGLDTDIVNKIINFSTRNFYPDLTLLIDIDYQTSLERTKIRGKGTDRFEELGELFFQNVRDTYLEIAAKNPARFAIINGKESIKDVQKSCITAINSLYNLEILVDK